MQRNVDQHVLLLLVAASVFPFLIGSTNAVATYSVVAPKILRPGLSYQVSLSVHDSREPVQATVAVGGTGLGGVSYGQTTQAIVQSGETQILKFEIGEWGPGKYNLSVSGKGGINFSNTTEIEYLDKSYSVFIQTDKAIYQPSQIVHFRAVVVNPMLRPTVSGAIEVYIMDGQGNRVKQWKRVFTSKGVFSADLQLSDQPVLGNWTINVMVSDQKYTKAFTVAEYVLPTFEVTVQLPPYATFNDSEVVATVTAKYTYGKPVKGEVTLVMTPRVHSPVIQVWLVPPIRKLATIDGIADIRLDLNDFKTQEDYQRDIRVEAIVTEALTGQRQNASSILSLHRHRVKFELIKTAETFKPGLKFTAFVKVAYQDDIPIRDDNNPIKIKYGYNYNETTHIAKEFPVPRNGILQLDFYPPMSPEANVLVIMAEYLDLQQPFPGIEASLSPSRNYIQARLLTDNPKVSQEIEMEINATERLTNFVVQVFGRGNLALAQTIAVNGEKSARFKFSANARMAPKVRLIVYYVRPDGEIVADALNFEVDGVFQTPVKIGVSVNQTQPGTQVEVRVDTMPNAYVGILGVDQKVLLLKSGNDITRQDVLDELMTYDSGKQNPAYDDFLYRYLWSPGTVTASQVFEDSGVVIITNGNVFQYYPRILYRSNVLFDSDLDFASDNSLQTRKFSELDGSTDEPRLRQHFPETWLWEGLMAGSDGSAVITSKAPDTITSWVISAFAIESISGLGVSRSPSKLTIFRPFFISLNLPYSVIRGEALSVQVVVFNYMQKDTEATVTIKNSGQFDFASFETQANEVSGSTPQQQKKVMIRAGDGASVSFMVVPKNLGYMDVEVSAQSSTAGDRVLKKLLVKPEGSPLHFNKAILIDLRKNPTFSTTIKVDIPTYAVPGSQRVEVSAIGDILGPAINNLDSLLRIPFGCGEQNMVNFVPNIVVADYLDSIGRLSENVRHKIVTHLETGYQRELTYKRSDGSFSAFGKQDKMGSTWLTAFVAKSFNQAQKYITIDENVVIGALKFLVAQQKADGSFPEVGAVSHKAMQGGAANGLALTAYVLITLLESGASQLPELNSALDKAKRRIEEAMLTEDDLYALAITTYALHLAGSQHRDTAFNKLAKRAKTTDGLMFWTRSSSSGEDGTTDSPPRNRTMGQAKSHDLEIVSYALLTYVLRNDVDSAIAVTKWMISQTNSNGGFVSTQDTVIGIQALAKLAQQISSPSKGIDITFAFKNVSKVIPLNNDNAMILHKLELYSDVRDVSVSAKGSGFAVVQVSYSYHLNLSEEKPAFRVNPLVDRNSHKNLLVINACTSYMNAGSSNMAVMEIDLPSGYTVDKDSLPAMLKEKYIMRADTKEQDSGVVIYFDKLTSDEICPTVKAYRTYKVARQKPTAVRVYDYYDLSRSARSFYQALPATLCDICEGKDCDVGQCPSEQLSNIVEGAGMMSASASVLLIVFAAALQVFLSWR